MIPARTQQHTHVPAGCKKALGSVAAPLVINQDTITKHTTQKKYLMAKIELHSSEHFAKEGYQTEIVMRLEVHKEVI